jgi:hypothetical protein
MAEKPAMTFRIGRIVVSIWRNTTKYGTEHYRADIARQWKEGEEWKESTGYYLEDLFILSHAALIAAEWVWDQKMAQNQEGELKVAQ